VGGHESGRRKARWSLSSAQAVERLIDRSREMLIYPSCQAVFRREVKRETSWARGALRGGGGRPFPAPRGGPVGAGSADGPPRRARTALGRRDRARRLRRSLETDHPRAVERSGGD